MSQCWAIAGVWNPIIQAKAMRIQISLPYTTLGTVVVLKVLVLLVEPLPAARGLRMRKRMKVQVGYE